MVFPRFKRNCLFELCICSDLYAVSHSHATQWNRTNCVCEKNECETTKAKDTTHIEWNENEKKNGKN